MAGYFECVSGCGAGAMHHFPDAVRVYAGEARSPGGSEGGGNDDCVLAVALSCVGVAIIAVVLVAIVVVRRHGQQQKELPPGEEDAKVPKNLSAPSTSCSPPVDGTYFSKNSATVGDVEPVPDAAPPNPIISGMMPGGGGPQQAAASPSPA